MPNDIRISTGFCDHYKTRELADTAGEAAVVCLLRLWCWAAQNRPDGDLSGLSDRSIERMAGWQGASGEFLNALSTNRFLDGRQLHNWAEHQPWVSSSRARSEAAMDLARKRWEKNAKAMPDVCEAHKDGNAPFLSSPILTKDIKEKDKKENRRSPPALKANQDPLIFLDQFPDEFKNDPVFVEAWKSWVEHRKEKGSPLHKLKTGAKTQIEELQKLSPSQAAECLQNSIKNGWTGIFPDKIKVAKVPAIKVSNASLIDSMIERLDENDTATSTRDGSKNLLSLPRLDYDITD